MNITPSIHTFINRINPTGAVFSSLPSSYVDIIVHNPIERPTSPYIGEQYYDINDNLLYYWDGSSWLSGGGSTGARVLVKGLKYLQPRLLIQV